MRKDRIETGYRLLKCNFSQLIIYFNEDINLLPNQYD